MRRRLVLAASLALSSIAVAVVGGPSGVTHAVPAGFTDDVVANVGPLTTVEALPDGRVIALEKLGRLLRVDDRNGAGTVTTLADFDVCTESERGLLGFAVDPAYGASGFVYVYRTIASSEPGGCHNRVSRFFMDEDGLDLGSELVLVDRISSLNGNHNGGDIEIGNDGYLYIATGDAGRDPRGDAVNDASQDLSLLNGKILRVDRSTGAAAPGNPFMTATGAADCRVRGNTSSTPVDSVCREIFAYGLRNPFRFAFDPNTSATRFFINDVGQGTREEVNEGIAGANYGWPEREGRCPQGQNPPCAAPPAALTDPVTDYNHGDGLFVTGGAFVPAGVWPSAYDGAYLVSDGAFGTTWSWTGGLDLADSPVFLTAQAPTDMVFVAGPDGTELWYVQQNGEVHKVSAPEREQEADSGAQRYEPLEAPDRRFDTRSTSPAAPLRAGSPTVIDLEAPTGASSALVNITLVRPRTAGAFATAWQPGTARPATSNLNAGEGEIVANSSIVPLDDDGQMLLSVSATADVIVDVSGFFFDATGPVRAGRFESTGPGRAVDTRGESGAENDYARVDAADGEVVTVPLLGVHGLPDDVGEISAVAVVLTAINRTDSGRGYVTAYPSTGARPNSSSVNVNAAIDLRANLAVVPIGPDGSIELFLASVDDMVIDVVGSFSGDASPESTDGRFHLIRPEREVDSRDGEGFARLDLGDTEMLNPESVPDDASALAQNLTVARTASRVYVTAYPAGVTRPVVSNVNASDANQIRAALALTRLGQGSEEFFAGEGSTDLIVDVFGWFE